MDIKRLEQELADLREVNDGVVQPRHLWLRARDHGHWLHDRFEWDNGTAADRYRDIQAASLIRLVKVERPEEPPVRELHPVRVGDGKRSYEHLSDVVARSTWADQLRERLQSEIVSNIRRWVPLGRRVGLDVEAVIAEALRRSTDRVA